MESTEQYTVGKRFTRQLLLIRYKMLLDKLEQLYPINEQQKAALQATILDMTWIDGAFN